MRVAALQMSSTADVDENFAAAARLMQQAAKQDAALVLLPENFSLMPKQDTDRLAHGEAGEGPCQTFLSEQARQLGLWVIAGSVPMAAEDGRRVRAASLVYNHLGEQVARYDKVHLFDVTISDAESYRESHTFEPGPVESDSFTCVDTPVGRVGLSVCYDLRFPEFYRILVGLGAQLLTVPAAFTATTGRAHWLPLLQARAIENQCYVIASAQTGLHASGRQTHGHSMIVGPWGDVLASCPQGEGVVTADVDTTALSQLRQRFPSLTHRRL